VTPNKTGLIRRSYYSNKYDQGFYMT